jgi:hypothetical protein
LRARIPSLFNLRELMACAVTPRAVQRSRLGLDESEMPHADETAVG